MLRTIGSDRRENRRRATFVEGLLANGRGSRRSVVTVDLSSEGFKAEVRPDPVTNGGAFSLKLANLETLGAVLRWARDMSAGFAFEQPLHPASLDHLVYAHPLGEPQG